VATADEAKRAVRGLVKRLENSHEQCVTAPYDKPCQCGPCRDALLGAVDGLIDAVGEALAALEPRLTHVNDHLAVAPDVARAEEALRRALAGLAATVEGGRP